MSRPSFVSRNGSFISPQEASVSVLNPAIYGAYGVYESMQVVGGIVFERSAHLRRLAQSAAILELPLPADLPEIGRWIEAVVARAAVPDCTIRLFALGPENGGDATAYIWPQPPTRYPADYYRDGVSAVTFEARRYLPQAKSLNSLASFMAQRQARSAGVHEAFLYHNGAITEGSNSNVFAVANGVVLTPPESEVLSGVTRDVVISLAAERGIPLRESPLPLHDLPQWDECFITSTSRHVMPVTSIDGYPVGSGGVGSMTTRLRALFEGYFAAYLEREAQLMRG
ncbi:MAG: aminotransferase class IV [Anaerolineae bacterium]|jgi:branched-subunit amino acid aminotransferase/4-amino-4-deoxychorismate lyase|nr:aminotransferase class IV [Anaerolineae bacterium]